jgi:hypothetical protein
MANPAGGANYQTYDIQLTSMTGSTIPICAVSPYMDNAGLPGGVTNINPGAVNLPSGLSGSGAATLVWQVDQNYYNNNGVWALRVNSADFSTIAFNGNILSPAFTQIAFPGSDIYGDTLPTWNFYPQAFSFVCVQPTPTTGQAPAGGSPAPAGGGAAPAGN